MSQVAALNPMTAHEISHEVISAALKVHSALGPGLLESAYEACLAHELRKAGFKVETQVGFYSCVQCRFVDSASSKAPAFGRVVMNNTQERQLRAFLYRNNYL